MRNVVGEIEDLLIVHGREDFSHCPIVAAPLLLADGLVAREIVLTLVCDVRNVVATGQIQIVGAVATDSA